MGQPQRVFDTLAYLNQLKAAGFSEKQATAQTEALFAVLDDQLLTEKDMRDIESNLKQDMHDREIRLNNHMYDMEVRLKKEMHDMEVGLKKEMHDVEVGLKQEMHDMEVGLKQEMHDIEIRLNNDIKGVEAKLNTTKHELITTLGSLMVILFTVFSGLNFGLTKFVH